MLNSCSVVWFIKILLFVCTFAHLHIRTSSFRSQTLYRICNCCFYCLETYGKQRNKQRRKTCNSKHPPTDINSVCKTLQPFVHCPPRCGECNKRSNQDKF